MDMACLPAVAAVVGMDPADQSDPVDLSDREAGAYWLAVVM
jgi:hypothetical protein